MLERIAKAIGNQASKIGWINREIQAYKIEKEKKAINERIKRNKADFTELMRCGNTVRSEDKDDGRMSIVVDYVGRGRVREAFNPVFSRMDCINWAERRDQHEKINQR